jgi:hypothetical protein
MEPSTHSTLGPNDPGFAPEAVAYPPLGADDPPVPEDGLPRSAAPGAPVIKRFGVSPDAVLLGDPFTLDWEVEGAETIEIVGFGRVHASVGRARVKVTKGQVFAIRATNAEGTTSLETGPTTVFRSSPFSAPKVTMPDFELSLSVPAHVFSLGRIGATRARTTSGRDLLAGLDSAGLRTPLASVELPPIPLLPAMPWISADEGAATDGDPS